MLAKANQGLATLEKYRERLDQVSDPPDHARVRGRRRPLRRARRPAAGRAGDPDGGRGRALHRRARHRGPPDRDAAGGDDGRRRRRQDRADPRLLGRRLRAEPGRRCCSRWPACPHQDVLDFGRLAELLGYDRKLNTLDFPVAPRGYRVLGRIPRIPKLVVQKIIHELGGLEEVLAASDADLEAVDGCRPDQGQGHPRGPAAGSRRSIWSTGTYRADGDRRRRRTERSNRFPS